ncbi:MAG: hypothetical protein FH762_20145 [Firmicutes bacterium]|nr:hypothetical protein [Bacillota bacterium]
MIDIIKIKEIIELIPLLLLYIAPGYITLWILGLLYSIDLEKDKNLILKSLILSSIYISIVRCLNLDPAISLKGKIVIFLISIFVAYITYHLSNQNCLMDTIGLKRTLHTDLFHDLVNVNNGPWMIIYITADNIIYKGKLVYFRKIDDKEEKFYIVLSNFTSMTDTGTVLDNYEDDDGSIVVLNTKDVNIIEMFGSNKL